MRTVDTHLLEEKMEEAVTHYINTHQQNNSVHVDPGTLSINVQDEGGARVVALMHPHSFSSQICNSRQVSVQEPVGEGTWNEELMEDSRIAALAAHLAHGCSRVLHHQLTSAHHKVSSSRSEVDSNVMLDNSPLRLFNGQPLDQQSDNLVVHMPSSLPPLPPLQGINKRNQDTDWFNKTKSTLKDQSEILSDGDRPVLEIGAGASPAHHKQQSKKSLPHKKRISKKLKRNNGNSTPQQVCESQILSDGDRPVLEIGAGASPAHHLPHKKRISKKLKRNNGNSTPQQVCEDMVVISCTEDVHHEEILPDNFVTAVQHQEQIPEDTHHIAQGDSMLNTDSMPRATTSTMRPILICQLCGDYYGEDQLKFYHHLREHYEPHETIIIENPVNDLGIDKMTNTCIVDNVATLPDSIVELSLENTMPKTTMYHQPMDKHILYSTSDKTLSYSGNKLQYSTASMEKEPVTSEAEKTDLYDDLEKVALYSCTRCNKSFRKQKHCEQHIKETHSKMEEINEFSEPEDLMEGIHVSVETEAEQYEQTLLPHLTVENGHIHQEHMRQWLQRNATLGPDGSYCPSLYPPPPHERSEPHSPMHLKEEVFQRMFEGDMDLPTTEDQNFTSEIIDEPTEIHPGENLDENSQSQPPVERPEPQAPDVKPALPEEIGPKKKSVKTLPCPQCPREFNHRNSLLYHIQRHKEKRPFECVDCSKGFYTNSALKVHSRVHNGDKPYKCDECGRDFRQWGDLKYHIVSKHSDKKMYKCDFCEKAFARKYSLSVHRRIHTGEKNYKCEYCTKTFRASSYRLTHMRTHTGYKPHKCPQCDKHFRGRGDLRRHLNTHEKRKANEAKLKEASNNAPKIQPIKQEVTVEIEVRPKEQLLTKVPTKKIAVASTTTIPAPKTTQTDRKTHKGAKKPPTKNAAPNITVAQRGEPGVFKHIDYPSNVEVFDTRQGNSQYTKFKEVYSDNNIVVTETINYSNKVKEAPGQNGGQRRLQERDFATLKPMFASSSINESEGEKLYVNRTENTDGKIFNVVEKKQYVGPIVANTNNPRTNEVKDGRTEINGDTIDNGFLERFSAFYNIPAV